MSWFVLAVFVAGFVLPVVREGLTKNDLESNDFDFLFTVHCSIAYVFNYAECASQNPPVVWPAYCCLAVFFVLAAPLILLNHDVRDLFAHFPAVIGGFRAFRKTVLGLSTSEVHRGSCQLKIALHPQSPHVAVGVPLTRGAGVGSIRVYKLEPEAAAAPSMGKCLEHVVLDPSFRAEVACAERCAVIAM